MSAPYRISYMERQEAGLQHASTAIPMGMGKGLVRGMLSPSVQQGLRGGAGRLDRFAARSMQNYVEGLWSGPEQELIGSGLRGYYSQIEPLVSRFQRWDAAGGLRGFARPQGAWERLGASTTWGIGRLASNTARGMGRAARVVGRGAAGSSLPMAQAGAYGIGLGAGVAVGLGRGAFNIGANLLHGAINVGRRIPLSTTGMIWGGSALFGLGAIGRGIVQGNLDTWTVTDERVSAQARLQNSVAGLPQALANRPR